MANGRFLSKRIALDGRFNSLSTEAALLFIMTIPHLDRDGIITGDLRELWAEVAPLQSAMRDRMAELVGEWEREELVLIYEASRTKALFFPGFSKNQKILYNREAASKFPVPPGYSRANDGLVRDNSQQLASPHDLSRQLASPHAEVEVQDQVEVEAEDTPKAPRRRPDSLSARYSHMVNSVGQTNTLDAQPEKFRDWFGRVAESYARQDFDQAVSKMAADYRAGDMGGLTVWQRTEQYLRAAAVSSNGHGPKLILYVDPVAPEGLT